MTSGQPAVAPKPSAQLPQGPYPASPAVIWAVTVMVLLTGLALGAVIPAALSVDAPVNSEQVVGADVTTGSPAGGHW